jgi:hypothetical protein
VLRATEIHESPVLQASVHHLHRTRKGRWLSVGVSEINLKNPVFTMRLEKVFTVFSTLQLDPVGREPRWGKPGPSKCLDSK